MSTRPECRSTIPGTTRPTPSQRLTAPWDASSRPIRSMSSATSSVGSKMVSNDSSAIWEPAKSLSMMNVRLKRISTATTSRSCVRT